MALATDLPNRLEIGSYPLHPPPPSFPHSHSTRLLNYELNARAGYPRHTSHFFLCYLLQTISFCSGELFKVLDTVQFTTFVFRDYINVNVYAWCLGYQQVERTIQTIYSATVENGNFINYKIQHSHSQAIVLTLYCLSLSQKRGIMS